MPSLSVLNPLLAAALLPLAAFLILLLGGRRLRRQPHWAGILALAFALASFALSLAALLLWVAKDRFNQPNYVEAFTYRWIQLPAAPQPPLARPAPPAPDGLTIGCLIDSLTIALFTVFTLLNLLVHLFAVGSLPRDEGRPRFFALLAFLNFALLGLFLSNSALQLFIFWEFISLAIYFLIRLGVPANPAASLRPYLMNSLGSAAFLLGAGIFILHTGSLSGLAFFDDGGTSILSSAIRQASNVQSSEYLFLPGTGGFLQMHWLTWVGICFLIAALARMAQFPFQTWLHDAAEAPAPVTALVAAATLAAGVCLLTRLYPILTLDVRLIAAVVGCVTLAAGAAIALVQNDLRKILAWSTVSQGGYVLLFLGSGGYAAGILHFFTHGFVKTALFLAAGSIIHGIGTADIRQLGGLWKRFPITAIGSLLAVLALGGAPWLSGSYSTNLGLACVYDYAHALQAAGGRPFVILLFHLPAACTYITALGIGRWWWLTFAGDNRNAKLLDAAHESPFLTLPLIILAAFYAGLLYDFAGILTLINKSIPAILLPRGGPALVIPGSDYARAAVIRDTGWAFLGLAAAVLIHVRGVSFSTRLRRFPGLNLVDYWLRERMFFDDLYEGMLLPAFLLLPRLVGALEWAGLTLRKMAASVAALAAVYVTRVWRSHQASLPPEPDPEDQNPEHGSA